MHTQFPSSVDPGNNNTCVDDLIVDESRPARERSPNGDERSVKPRMVASPSDLHPTLRGSVVEEGNRDKANFLLPRQVSSLVAVHRNHTACELKTGLHVRGFRGEKGGRVSMTATIMS